MASSNIKKNFLYNSMYQILALLLPLITTPYISRVLGAEGIGEYAYHFSVAKYFVLFAMLGLNNYGNRTIASVRDDEDKLSKTFSSIYVMQITFAVTVFIAYIGYVLISGSGSMAYVLCFYVLSSVMDINWFFFGIEQFKLTVIRNTFIKLISVACIFVFVKTKSDVYVYGLIMALSFFCSQLAVWPFVRKYTHFTKPSIQDVFLHVKPNLLLFVPVIAVSLYKSMDKIMLGMMTNLTEVGYYQNSEKIIDIPESLIMALGTVMLPRMSNLIANNKKEEGTRYIYYSILFAAFLSSSLGFGIAGISREFVPWFFGQGFNPCITIFSILAPSTVFIALANVIRTQYLIPTHKDKIYISSVFIGATINLLLNAILIPYFYAAGAAIGTLAAEGAVCIYQYYKVRNDANFLQPVVRSIPLLFSGFLMFLLLRSFELPFNNLLVCILMKILIGAIVYLLSASILYVVRKHVLRKDDVIPGGIKRLLKRN